MTNYLREIRTRSRLSAAQLAARAGVSRQDHPCDRERQPCSQYCFSAACRTARSERRRYFPIGRSRARRRRAGRVGCGSNVCRGAAALGPGRTPLGRRAVVAEAFALPLFDATAISQSRAGWIDVHWRDGARLGDNRLALAGCDPGGLAAGRAGQECRRNRIARRPKRERKGLAYAPGRTRSLGGRPSRQEPGRAFRPVAGLLPSPNGKRAW